MRESNGCDCVSLVTDTVRGAMGVRLRWLRNKLPANTGILSICVDLAHPRFRHFVVSGVRRVATGRIATASGVWTRLSLGD